MNNDSAVGLIGDLPTKAEKKGVKELKKKKSCKEIEKRGKEKEEKRDEKGLLGSFIIPTLTC